MMSEKIRFHAMVHDLKNPIGILLANLALLSDETFGPLTQKQHNIVERSMRSAKNVQEVVKNILELGRSEQGRLNHSEFTLAKLIAGVMVEVVDIDHTFLKRRNDTAALRELQNRISANHISIQIDEHLWPQKIVSDFGKLKQILANLISNAIKFKRQMVEISVTGDTGHLEFAIKDDGQGIPPIYHDKIFESYFQMQTSFEASVRGHGIGLAAVAVLVKDLKGKLELISAQGEGANFIVRLPISSPKQEN